MLCDLNQVIKVYNPVSSCHSPTTNFNQAISQAEFLKSFKGVPEKSIGGTYSKDKKSTYKQT